MIQERSMDINKILNYYGRENQLLKSIEELDELKDAIRKERTADTLDNYNYDVKAEVMTELADVLIMCEQLRRMHSIPLCELEREINYKVDRQLKRMEGEKND